MAARHTTRAAMTAPRRACLGAALAQEGRKADVGASGRAVSAGASRKQQCGLAPYPTDLTDKEWSRIEPLSPPCGVLGAQAVGRPAGGPEREPLYGAVGQPLADAAEGFPTLADVGSSLAFSAVMMVRSSRP